MFVGEPATAVADAAPAVTVAVRLPETVAEFVGEVEWPQQAIPETNSTRSAANRRTFVIYLRQRRGRSEDSSGDRDFVADVDRAAAHDVAAQPATMYQRLQQAVLTGEALEVFARFAEAGPA